MTKDNPVIKRFRERFGFMFRVRKAGQNTLEAFILDEVQRGKEEERNIKEAPKSVMLIALQESLKLQAHYAGILNDYDGGERMIFKSVSQWLERLKKTGTFDNLEALSPKEKETEV